MPKSDREIEIEIEMAILGEIAFCYSCGELCHRDNNRTLRTYTCKKCGNRWDERYRPGMSSSLSDIFFKNKETMIKRWREGNHSFNGLSGGYAFY